VNLDSKTILIVDQDLGFVFWVGQALDRAGYNAIPAKSVVDGIQLVSEGDLFVELLVLSLGLTGAGIFLKLLRRKYERLKVLIVLENEGDDAPADLVGDAVLAKPSTIDDVARLK